MNDGEAALQYLRGRDENGHHNQRPDLILLDLNLPKLSGHEILAELKSDENLLSIPVVMLTSSDDDHDIARTYSEHANCYITKPPDLQGFISIVSAIENFWFTIVTLP